ncbi:MAG: hypothetical protein OXQ31_26570 [Spirochaetaceae bacterium]|nr:hypothetical protein [Spirochaetaceae bacterium]
MGNAVVESVEGFLMSIEWSLWLVMVGCLMLAVVVLAVGLLFRRRR